MRMECVVAQREVLHEGQHESTIFEMMAQRDGHMVFKDEHGARRCFASGLWLEDVCLHDMEHGANCGHVGAWMSETRVHDGNSRFTGVCAHACAFVWRFSRRTQAGCP